MPIGAKVTLRKTRMYEFLDRLVNIALPRVRDFRGLNPKSFDGRGNYALGIKEHLVFPEINYDKAEAIWGMDVVIAHDGEDRRRGAGPAHPFQLPVPAVRARRALKRGHWREAPMAKKSSVEKNNRRKRLVKQYAGKRERLLAVANDESKAMEERFEARLKLAEIAAQRQRPASAIAAR